MMTRNYFTVESRKNIAWYFNIPERAVSDYKKQIDVMHLYDKFIRANSIREQKNYLYSLKSQRIKEDRLDYLWENYIQRIEHEMFLPKEQWSMKKIRRIFA